MKKNIWYCVFFFLLLIGLFGSEVLYSFVINTDFNLEKSVVLSSEYLSLKKQYEELNSKVELFLEDTDKVISKVVLRDPFFFFERFTLLKGKEEGIEIGDVVYNEEGYIGKVKSLKSHSCEVELLTNKNTKLSVRIHNSYGILEKENGDLVINHITSKEEFLEGDLVYTSSFDHQPGDILVAKVTKVIQNDLSQKLVVTPIVSFDHLNYVFIKKQVNYE